MKVCKVYPSLSHCGTCMNIWESYDYDISQMPSCGKCKFSLREYKIMGFVNGLFSTYALLEHSGKLEKVLISRLHDIREVE